MNALAKLLEVWRVMRADKAFPRPPQAEEKYRAALADIDGNETLARKALDIAIGQLGCGESGGDNCGPDVERYIAPGRAPANWCAGFVGYCYERAAFELRVPLPFKRSLGAKALGKAIAAVGRKFTDPREAQPGDVLVLDRGATGSWLGHIAIVERVAGEAVHTVEGNSGPKVRRVIRPVPVPRLAFCASLRRR